MKYFLTLSLALLSYGLSFAQLPNPGFVIDQHTAFVITDPQNDFLSEKGKLWGAVKNDAMKKGTIENLRRLFEAAQKTNKLVFISPHYYYPYDKQWIAQGTGETLMHATGSFDRKDILNTDGLSGSGADWLSVYKPYINQGKNIIITAPHKIFGPENNDLILQLRKRGINKIILAGMSGNLCVDLHLRELVERGFEVAVVFDATASPELPASNGNPAIDGPTASYTNFRLISSKVYTTKELLSELK